MGTAVIKSCVIFALLAIGLYVISAGQTTASPTARWRFAVIGAAMGAAAFLVPSAFGLAFYTMVGLVAMIVFLTLYYVVLGWWANTTLDLDYREAERVNLAALAVTVATWACVGIFWR